MSAEGLNLAILRAFAKSLDWANGDTKNAQTHRIFLRAASLGVRADTALKTAREFVLVAKGRLVPRDLKHQCRSAYNFVAGQNPTDIDLSRFTPDATGNLVPNRNLADSFDRSKLATRAADFPAAVTPDYLRQRSPTWPTCWHSFLRGLFPPLPRRVPLVFNQMKSRVPMRLSSLPPTGLSAPNGVWFLSNAVDGHSHPNADGQPSWRCEAAVTDFRHLVLECDHEGDDIAEDWLRFLVLLPMPIRAIYTSGGKSVHALVAVNAKSKADWDSIVGPLKRPLVECGADHGAISAVRLTRLPYCFRESTGRWQELIYFRPDADGTPIARMEVVT